MKQDCIIVYSLHCSILSLTLTFLSFFPVFEWAFQNFGFHIITLAITITTTNAIIAAVWLCTVCCCFRFRFRFPFPFPFRFCLCYFSIEVLVVTVLTSVLVTFLVPLLMFLLELVQLYILSLVVSVFGFEFLHFFDRASSVTPSSSSSYSTLFFFFLFLWPSWFKLLALPVFVALFSIFVTLQTILHFPYFILNSCSIRVIAFVFFLFNVE